ncbi:MAG: polysaccharide deacetylase family protein [Candidatus Aminicenantes bacterium]|nr:polysaccharide deacetylase family protein [Candidatus Aminicenantes bacterium]
MNFVDRPRLFHENPASKDAIALTFDDGPCFTSTPDVLDLLKEQAVRATFFMIGERVRRHPDLARRVFNGGHQIANHSDRHVAFRSLVPSVCKKEIEKAEQTFRSVMGIAPRFYRAPKGLINRYVIKAISSAGYYVASWSCMPGDYFGWHTAAWIGKRLSKVRPGHIVVLHDGLSRQPEPDRTRTLSILPGFIRGMKKQGICFVTIADLFGLPPYF